MNTEATDETDPISNEIDQICKHVTEGLAEDFADYQRLCGMIAGLRRALELTASTDDDPDPDLGSVQLPFRLN